MKLRRSRWLHLALMTAALALLGLYLRELGRGTDTAPLPTGPLPRGAGAAVDRIEIAGTTPPGETGPPTWRILIERDASFWRIRRPLPDLASTRTVREFLRAIEDLRIERLLIEGDPADFGLEPARCTIRVSAGEAPALVLEVGDLAASGLEVYAHWAGLGGIAILPRYLSTRFLQPDLMPWRESELIPPRQAPVDSVTVLWRGGRARLARRDHKDWLFLEPAGLTADGEACERAIAAFWRFPFNVFLDDPAQSEGLGLRPPRAVWIVHRGGTADTLAIGDRVPEGQMAVQLSGRVPGLVREDTHGLLTGGLASLESRAPLRGDPTSVRLLAVTADDGRGRAFRRAGAAAWQWRDLEPEELSAAQQGTPPDTAAAAGSWLPLRDAGFAGDLANLLDLRGEAWAAPLTGPAHPARTDAALRILLWDQTGSWQWMLVQPEPDAAGDRPPAQEAACTGPPELVGQAVSSLHPARPMQVVSAALFNWRLRLERTAPAATAP